MGKTGERSLYTDFGACWGTLQEQRSFSSLPPGIYTVPPAGGNPAQTLAP